ncbi:MAG: dCTP deaminase [Candidatus Marsarchaeota archaeon]|nr:dCTP deaminase [Candidatus Marsarchaeota archaeon]
MSVITHNGIRKLLASGKLRIEPFDYSQIGPGSIDLRLGDEFRVFSSSAKALEVDDNLDHKVVSRLVRISEKGSITIKPGQFINGITMERISLPRAISGRIEGRSRFARIGLLVHVSSGFVQPGSDGRVVLEIANLSPVSLKLKPGVRICQIILEEARGGGAYKGRYYGQESP